MPKLIEITGKSRSTIIRYLKQAETKGEEKGGSTPKSFPRLKTIERVERDLDRLRDDLLSEAATDEEKQIAKKIVTFLRSLKTVKESKKELPE